MAPALEVVEGVALAAIGRRLEPPAGSAISAELSEELRVALDSWKATQDPFSSQQVDGEGRASCHRGPLLITPAPRPLPAPAPGPCSPQASLILPHGDHLPGSVSLTQGASLLE